MYLPLLSFLLVFVSSTSSIPIQNVTIGAFNIQIFGATKAKKDAVMENIRDIILGYDVILIQEIRDKSQKSMEKLLKILNNDPNVKFSYIKSDRLGRSRSKEQYAFFYRSDRLDIIQTYQYRDENDKFEREPFSVLVRVQRQNDEVFTFALIGLHAKPSEAVEEIDEMDEVSDTVKSKMFIKNFIIMGDLNADCRYAKDSELAKTKVFSDTDNYLSLIDSSTDTTTSTTTDCSYDRIIISGKDLMSKTMTPEVDRFDTKLNLTYSQTKAVSDHYPVKVTILL